MILVNKADLTDVWSVDNHSIIRLVRKGVTVSRLVQTPAMGVEEAFHMQGTALPEQ